MLDEILAGMRQTPKRLPSKYLYDDLGAALFEQITLLPEYYPTRTERTIMRANADAISRWIGDRLRIVEFGSGSGEKIRDLMRTLPKGVDYIPIDISALQLEEFAEELRHEMPHVSVAPIVADYTRPLDLPAIAPAIVFFPGSTIGNFEPDEALVFLENARAVAGRGGGLLIGVDTRKDKEILERAYNDAQGVTAAFNLNLLTHINRECSADFDLRRFKHRALYNEVHGRIEMHLISLADQTVTISDERFLVLRGEYVVTEYSYKYTIPQFRKLAQRARLRPADIWTDSSNSFSVHALDAD